MKLIIVIFNSMNFFNLKTNNTCKKSSYSSSSVTFELRFPQKIVHSSLVDAFISET